MSSLALVYVDVTKHIVSSALVQSAYSTPPKLEDLVGTGPRIRDPDSGAPAINVASANVSLKILVLDTSTFNDRAMLDGLLGDPFNFYLAPKNAHDLTSPLVPTLAQPDGVTAAPVAGAGNTVAPSADASGTLQL